MTQQEIANKVDLTNMTSGSVQTDTEYYLNVISNIMTSLLYLSGVSGKCDSGGRGKVIKPRSSAIFKIRIQMLV